MKKRKSIDELTSKFEEFIKGKKLKDNNKTDLEILLKKAIKQKDNPLNCKK